MTDTPWLGDTCSLVDAFRSGERSPVEELEATLAAIEVSDLNAFTRVHAEQARAAAASADISLPFGGVPLGIKALTPVKGWPHDECSLAMEGEIADHTSLHVERLTAAGAEIGRASCRERV